MIRSESTAPDARDPLITVMIPVYNVSRYLPQCLESLICQTYRNLDILVIDDGSTDDSGSICDAFAEKDGRVRVLHTENRGLGSTRNLAVQNAEGSLYMFLDSDDWIEPHAVETMQRAMTQTGADIVVVRDCKEYVGETVHPRAMEEGVRVFRGEEILPAYMEIPLCDQVWNKLYRASCFDNIRFPDGRSYEDAATTWRILKTMAETAGTVAFLPDELIHFRMRKSSITHTNCMCNIVDRWWAFHGKYEGLPAYRKENLPDCFLDIRRMWFNYSGFSKEEKQAAAEVLREMQRFSRAHFRQVMKGAYSRLVKTTCLLSRSRSPLLLWLCFHGKKLPKACKKPGRTLFE